MRIQEQMAVRLNCESWEEVTRDYPLSSSYEALAPFKLAFSKIVSLILQILDLHAI